MVTTSSGLTITRKTKGKLPRLPFLKWKNAVLGRYYELSVVFTDDAETRRLNKIYRGKSKPANILSFPISKNNGEIYLNRKEINKSAKKFRRTGDRLLAFFFVHGLVHLKGMRHGDTMEKTEATYLRRFGI